VIKTLGKDCSPESKTPFWIDVQEPSLGELNELATKYGIPETLITDCLDPAHLPKYEAFDHIRFFIFRFADETAVVKADADTIRELTRKVAVFYLPNGLITVHRSSHGFLDKMRETWTKRGLDKPAQLPHLFNTLVRELIRTYDRSLAKIEDVFEDYEILLLQPMRSEVRIEQLYFLKRKTTVYKKMLWSLGDVLRKAGDLPFRATTHFKNLLEESDKQFFHADELVEDVTNLMQTQLSLASHRTNEVVRVLTLFSVFFLPLTFVVGIYGMNFQHMPELKWQYGYPAVMAFMVVLTAVIGVWFKRRSWI